MRMVILYGSQTGTAQNVAEQIWRESKTWGFNGPVLPMDEYPVQQLIEEKLAIFVVATTGNGDEPDNMRKTWRFLLRRSLPADSLQRLNFACLGLGDSSYAKFNFTAKKLNKRLMQLGAIPILDLGLCDDQHDHGLSATALPWIAQLWQKLGKSLSYEKLKQNGEAKKIFKWNTTIVEPATSLVEETHLEWPLKSEAICFTLKENLRTTAADHFQDVRFLSFSFPSSIKWNAGDVLDLRPANSDEQVSQFFALVKEHNLGFNEETIVKLETVYDDMPVPLAYAKPVNIRMLAKYIWDLNACPRQRAFELLSLNCEDELEKEKLEEFTSIEGLDDLINYVNRPRRTILEVLQDFRHSTSKLELPILFELFTMIQPRSYSIASMPSSCSLDILVAVVEYKTKMSLPRLGLCSNWLKTLSVGSIVKGVIKSGTMSLPVEAATPIIMVGPGTGIAPFRSVIQYRKEQQKNGAKIGDLVVFFGCRNKAKDYHFVEDFTRWQLDEFCTIFVAFSRDQERKVYVQHLIKQEKALMSELILEKMASIMVAGSSNSMPKAVREAFIEVLDGDEEYLEHMLKSRRYQEETWS
ncbi:NADPH-dependent diflavin oxidoreductase 1 isoform X2 [Anastrepha obliqua]|uniref:NADPH-dependent diflavin oxidoreductase 1 isoform X2 n=1 Tax=Anastrepha obliqua TaxID=95512 RepID=UPI00240A13DB|nr:NADPH-dependent diflavin oxidoreductase 1 isoform X2 [Anastrepha obliqua]XP_054735754.1 NADPH-dependent diflavin oxidoreductase 1 isoform X2 [Anastrepha obliqua]